MWLWSLKHLEKIFISVCWQTPAAIVCSSKALSLSAAFAVSRLRLHSHPRLFTHFFTICSRLFPLMGLSWKCFCTHFSHLHFDLKHIFLKGASPTSGGRGVLHRSKRFTCFCFYFCFEAMQDFSQVWRKTFLNIKINSETQSLVVESEHSNCPSVTKSC